MTESDVDIFAANASAIFGAANLGLVTFAIVFEASRSFAVAAFVVFPFACFVVELSNLKFLFFASANSLRFSAASEKSNYLWPKCVGIPFKTLLDGSLPGLFMTKIVEAIVAIAIMAKFAVGKTFAIKF